MTPSPLPLVYGLVATLILLACTIPGVAQELRLTQTYGEEPFSQIGPAATGACQSLGTIPGAFQLPQAIQRVSDCGGLGCPVAAHTAMAYAKAFVAFDLLVHNVEVHRAPQPIASERAVTDATGQPLIVLHEPAWLFLIDDAPGTFWSHPARLLLLGVESGNVCVIPTDGFPLLDGEEPLFDDDQDSRVFAFPAHPSERLALFPALPPPPIIAPLAEEMVAYTLETDELFCPYERMEMPWCGEGSYPCGPTPPKRYAILLYGPPRQVGKWQAQHDKKDITNAMTAMQGQLPRYNFQVLGPFNLAKQQTALKKTIAALGNILQCEDEVFVYYHGHGQRIQNKGKGAFTYRIGGQTGLTADALRDILKPLPTCHLHAMLDACYSGGFVDVLNVLPGLESMYTSAAADELAWVSAVTTLKNPLTKKEVVDPLRVGEKGGEFSSGVVQFLVTSFHLRQLDVTTLLQKAVAFAKQNDVAALAQITHPQEYQRQKTCVCDQNGVRYAGLLDCPNDGYVSSSDELLWRLQEPIVLQPTALFNRAVDY